MSAQTNSTSIPENTESILWGARLVTHMRDPQNLIGWLLLTAWMKFMGVSEHIPSITIG